MSNFSITANPLPRPADYAGIFFDGNTDATVINLIDTYELVTGFDTDMPEKVSDGDNASDSITVGATGDYKINICSSATPASTNKTYEGFVFEMDATGAAITGASEATPAVITAVAHGFSNGNRVRITGVGGMVELNDRIYLIANKADDTFELTDEEGVNIASGGFTTYTSGGTATLATRTATQLHRKFAAQDLGAWDGCEIRSLTQDKVLQFYIRGRTDATNITFEYINFLIERVG